MLLFDLTPDSAASEGHISLPVQGNIRVDFSLTSQIPKLSRVCSTSNMTTVSG